MVHQALAKGAPIHTPSIPSLSFCDLLVLLLKMKTQSSLALLCAMAVVVAVLLGEASVVKAVTCNPTELSPCIDAYTSSKPPSTTCCVKAVTCNPTELSPCIDAYTSSKPPSTTCCVKLREQKPCLCGYKKDPNLSQYVNSPNTKRIANACGVPIPTC
ncbi:hypothetical protein LOK49_LG01G03492 [Camellia lanceoleosa]|uniref:Uncharacterized protein n=1 Tax=Camellia lanceoleosa TaxID=1840588 RepID=A0ACC0J342_9ERIC|nr:hypothetical protein LOK49_LG01G03492 [Camellia lanceoleosa]